MQITACSVVKGANKLFDWVVLLALTHLKEIAFSAYFPALVIQ